MSGLKRGRDSDEEDIVPRVRPRRSTSEPETKVGVGGKRKPLFEDSREFKRRKERASLKKKRAYEDTSLDLLNQNFKKAKPNASQTRLSALLK